MSMALDPLIAEAKRRRRQRRLLLLALLVGLVAIAVGVALAMRSPSGPSGGGSASGPGVQSGSGFGHLVVPVDTVERQWRTALRRQAPTHPAVRATVPGTERKVREDVALSGATLVRLKVWPKYFGLYLRPPVELVVATATPVTFLQDHYIKLYTAINGGRWATLVFFKVVNHHGARIIESAIGPHGTVTQYIQPRLRNCVGSEYTGETLPCPTS